MCKKVFFTLLLLVWSGLLIFAQEAIVDTTDVRYKVGYKIGTYLPISIILLMAIFFIRRAYKFKE
ncbi:MAG: hypothetical protein KDC85_19550 [Saprospiraceae bacterium]|nr:hypothetical protein [Saprospiraceae bacterium]